MKKILCAIIVLVLALSMSALGEGFGIVKTSIDGIDVTSDTFDKTLAMFIGTSFMSQDAEGAAKDMTDAGFEVMAQEYYGKELSDKSHTSAYTVGLGKMDVMGNERDAVAIAVRATADGEWYSNFDFAPYTKGECEYAENFYEAAQHVFEGAQPVIDSANDPVILVTGYSRGAATANLLGVMLDETYDPANIYVYTFATPNTVMTADTEYANIFNIVNYNDAVTHMPMESMGFKRAGIDIVLRDESYDSTPMEQFFETVAALCPTIDDYYDTRHSLEGPGTADDGMTVFEMVELFSVKMVGDESQMKMATMKLMGLNEAENDLTPFIKAFASDTMLFGQHMPNVYFTLFAAME